MTRFEELVRNRAFKIHADVNQKYDGNAYSYHLEMVAENVRKNISIKDPNYNKLIFGAYFHDSIEDARLTYNDVLKIAKEYFENDDDAVAATEIVYALTNEKGRNRAERANERYYYGIRITEGAPIVKACDRLANIQYSHLTNSRMEKVYGEEMSEFLNKIGTNMPPRLLEQLRSYIPNTEN